MSSKRKSDTSYEDEESEKKQKGYYGEEDNELAAGAEYKATVQQQLEYLKQLSSSTSDSSSGSLPKNLSNEPPSRVVHFRNVTQDITQGDIMSLCVPFGHVENVLIVRTRNQCLVMFRTLAASLEFMNYYISNYAQPTVRGRKMYIKFSRHQQITAENSRVSNILLVTFHCTPEPEEAGVPITTDVVYQIFTPYGVVQKIVIVKKQSLQALVKIYVQFETQAHCAQAYDYLNEQKVYVGTDPIVEIKLAIQYSHLADLTIRLPQQALRTISPLGYQAPTSADYTLGAKTYPSAYDITGASASASTSAASASPSIPPPLSTTPTSYPLPTQYGIPTTTAPYSMAPTSLPYAPPSTYAPPGGQWSYPLGAGATSASNGTSGTGTLSYSSSTTTPSGAGYGQYGYSPAPLPGYQYPMGPAM